jgi:aminoglycoside 3-N-acetyltransferase
MGSSSSRLHGLKQPISTLLRWKARTVRYLRRRYTHLDQQAIRVTLESFGRLRATVLLVHSSLSACGHIAGGAPMVLKTLRSWGKLSSLAMPTHTYCYPRGNKPASCFDPAQTSSVVGVITDIFWRQPRVTRSLHPTHSLACEGPLAEEFCRGHEFTDTPCGKGTPYERLVQRDAAVLMFGVSLNAYTLFHTTEDAANVPYLYEPRGYTLAVKNPSGLTIPFPMRRQDMSVDRRFAAMDVWLEKRGLLFRRALGLAELLYVPSAAAVHYTLIEELLRDPWFLLSDFARAKLASLSSPQTAQKDSDHGPK